MSQGGGGCDVYVSPHFCLLSTYLTNKAVKQRVSFISFLLRTPAYILSKNTKTRYRLIFDFTPTFTSKTMTDFSQ